MWDQPVTLLQQEHVFIWSHLRPSRSNREYFKVSSMQDHLKSGHCFISLIFNNLTRWIFRGNTEVTTNYQWIWSSIKYKWGFEFYIFNTQWKFNTARQRSKTCVSVTHKQVHTRITVSTSNDFFLTHTHAYIHTSTSVKNTHIHGKTQSQGWIQHKMKSILTISCV